MRTEIALEQEKVIERHEKTVERLEKELKVKSKKLGTLDVSEETLKTTIAELKETLDAKEKKIKENEKIIDWLNRRCTEAAMQSYSILYSRTANLKEHHDRPWQRRKRSWKGRR
uniref:Uncharacterized protein n=1 Tax=Lygus hesperus TaxID=30085 RepID=A0A146M6Z8_LYGHE